VTKGTDLPFIINATSSAPQKVKGNPSEFAQMKTETARHTYDDSFKKCINRHGTLKPLGSLSGVADDFLLQPCSMVVNFCGKLLLLKLRIGY
jgi:hypothetical protein